MLIGSKITMKIGSVCKLTWKEDEKYTVIVRVAKIDKGSRPVYYCGFLIRHTWHTSKYFVGNESDFWFSNKYWKIKVLPKKEAFLEMI